jgi:hypothetical protein
MVMIRKASPVKMEEMDQGKDQNNFADVSDFSESDGVGELNQWKDQNDFSDISDISESDEDDSEGEYNADDVGAEDGVSIDEKNVISDHDDWVLPNRGNVRLPCLT